MNISQGTGVISRLEYVYVGDGEHAIQPSFNGGIRRRYSIVLLHILTAGIRCVQSDAEVACSIGMAGNVVFQGVLKNPIDIIKFPSDILQRRSLSKARKENCVSCLHLFTSGDIFKIWKS